MDIEKMQRELEAALESDIDLLRRAHDAKLRALRVLGAGEAGEAEPKPRQPAPKVRTTKGNGGGTLTEKTAKAIREALPQLPQRFGRPDIDPYASDVSRGTTARALDLLQEEGVIREVEPAAGRRPAEYEKVNDAS